MSKKNSSARVFNHRGFMQIATLWQKHPWRWKFFFGFLSNTKKRNDDWRVWDCFFFVRWHVSVH